MIVPIFRRGTFHAADSGLISYPIGRSSSHPVKEVTLTSSSTAPSPPLLLSRNSLPTPSTSARAGTCGLQSRDQLTAEALEAYKPGQRVAPLLVPACQWEVPLLANNESRIMLTVAFFKGKWQAVEAGGIQLAERWQSFTADLAATPVAGEKEAGRRIRLVRVYEIGGNFAFIESEEEETLIPLIAYGGALPGVENLKRYAPAELIPQVTAAVRQLIEAQGGE